MKITVISNKEGKVVGTMRRTEKSSDLASRSVPEVQVVPGPDQLIREVEVPEDAANGSVEEFHRKVAQYLEK